LYLCRRTRGKGGGKRASATVKTVVTIMMMMNSTAQEAIAKLLSVQEKQSKDDGSGDIVWVLFLEPSNPSNTNANDANDTTTTCFNRIIDFIVRNFQPGIGPVMVHVEIIVAPVQASHDPISFSTYIGERSGWRDDRATNTRYYLEDTCNQWRAVPVLSKHVARLVREKCNASNDVPYSLFRYATAAWGLRKLAFMVPDGPRRPAHCATLTARVLRNVVPNLIRHSSAWYSPSALYWELCGFLTSNTFKEQRTLQFEDETNRTDTETCVETLLRGSEEEVDNMDESDILHCIRAMTFKTALAMASTNTQCGGVTEQKHLAMALLRWSIRRSQ
jgi:hypothetical protein